MTIPNTTYRVQLTPDFNFDDATAVVAYLKSLGVSDLYCSPVFKSVTGSTHGYDVVDPTRLNEELGGETGLERLNAELGKHDMGWLQDIVPNHMAFDSQNHMLMDIFENGQTSRYANYFDIDWNHIYESLQGRLLAPFLGKFYGEALEAGEIALHYDRDGLSVGYYGLRFPLRIESYPEILTHELGRLEERLGPHDTTLIKFIGTVYALNDLPGRDHLDERYDQIRLTKRLLWNMYTGNDAIQSYVDETLNLFNGEPGDDDSFDSLDHLLGNQHFRLSFWKVASEEINYRRFFTINGLISVRLEDPEVFEVTHRLIRKMCTNGVFTGLRVDHIDGLNDPSDYLERLREVAPDVYLVVEKILEPGEVLPPDWPVEGTTGYDFLNTVNGLFCDRRAEKAFNTLYNRFARLQTTWERLVADKKRLIVDKHLAGNIDSLAHLLKGISHRDRHGNDITLYGLRRALIEAMACFPTYRTYVNSKRFTEVDRQSIERAVSKAHDRNPDLRYELDYIKKFLLMGSRDDIEEKQRRQAVDFVMKFQQVTGPLMAKGVEDTCLYIFNRLLSLNEVGGSPNRFGCSREDFHGFMRDTVDHCLHAMNTTATHDTKRGEDARMRLNVLTEMPDEWDRAIRDWRKTTSRRRVVRGSKVPDKNDEYFLYQSLIAFWPLQERDREGFAERLKDYTIKAVREAKVHTAWLKPDEEYENAYLQFIDRLLAEGNDNRFLESFLPFCKKITWHGMLNSLGQTLIKFTAPGVPDIYQGNELWDFDMVDPDNRCPVDYRFRANSLEYIRGRLPTDRDGLLDELMNSMYDGRIKLFLTHRTLAARSDQPDVFISGDYRPLEATGKCERNVVAYARRAGDRWALAVLPRLTVGLVEENEFPVGEAVWGDTMIELPEQIPESFTDYLTGRRLDLEGKLRLAELFEHLPWALLVSE